MSIEAKFLHLQAIQNLLAPYRYLYRVDLEATCDEVGESESPRQLAVVSAQMETESPPASHQSVDLPFERRRSPFTKMMSMGE